jgi:hypothetical protein
MGSVWLGWAVAPLPTMLAEDRRRVGWSVEQAARRLGVSASTYEELEAGTRKPEWGSGTESARRSAGNKRHRSNLRPNERRAGRGPWWPTGPLVTARPCATLRLALAAESSAARSLVAHAVVPTRPLRAVRAEVPRLDSSLLPVLLRIRGHEANRTVADLKGDDLTQICKTFGWPQTFVTAPWYEAPSSADNRFGLERWSG